MLKTLKDYVMNLYIRYELVTCISMFEPWEKKLINSIVAVILGLFLFSSCMYLPTYIQTFLQFISPLPLEPSSKAAPYAPILQTEKLNMI